MADLYRGSRLSKFFGFLSVSTLIWAIVAVVGLQWRVALGAFVFSVLTAYVGYRIAGGRNNPGLATARWENQRQIDFVSDPVASWAAKIEALFELYEKDFGGDYSTAVAQLKLLNVPEPVRLAYERAVRHPSRESWIELKRALLENPPPHTS